MDSALLVKALGGLFAIMNPFVALPMFLTLTAGYDVKRQRHTAVRVAIYSLVMSLVVMVAGKAILSFFGVQIDDFRIAGGLVLLTIALGMLNGGGNSAHAGSKEEQAHQEAHAATNDVSFYPMSFPMMVGPGTITTIVVFAESGGASSYVSVAAALVAVVAVLFAVLWFAPDIGKHMSGTLRTIMTRLMGMILAAISVEMIVVGLAHVFPMLTH